MHIHNIDLHYHAGQERAEGVSLKDHLVHARLTGRKLLGITDHLGKYLQAQQPGRHYPASIEGLLQYRAELDRLKPEFPDLDLYFAPEIPPGQVLSEIPRTVIEASDFFIGEASFPGDYIEENTDSIVEKIIDLHTFSNTVHRQVFLAHPFRSAVNMRLVKRDAEPWVSNLAPRWDQDFPLELLVEFFRLDLTAVANAATRYKIPLEINGNTQQRIRASNLPAPLQMLWKAHEFFHGLGVELVPGSDQHGFMAGVGRMGGAVPADCFEALGIEVKDIDFLKRIAETQKK